MAIRMKLSAVFLVCLAVTMILCAGTVAATLAQLRQKVCGSDSDCVQVTGGTGKMMVDGLDFSHDTVGDLLQKLPSWFGPARPVKFLLKGEPVASDKKFAELGIPLGAQLQMISAARDEL